MFVESLFPIDKEIDLMLLNMTFNFVNNLFCVLIRGLL